MVAQGLGLGLPGGRRAGRQPIRDIRLAVDAPSFVFDIPAGFQGLSLRGAARAAAGGTSIIDVLGRINNDGSTVYDYVGWVNYSVLTGAVRNVGQTAALLGTVTTTGWPFWSIFAIAIDWPDSTEYDKSIVSDSYYRIGVASGDLRDNHFRNIWRPATPAPITSFVLSLNGGGNFLAGSRFALSGVA